VMLLLMAARMHQSSSWMPILSPAPTDPTATY
jgi:hypothetical protein